MSERQAERLEKGQRARAQGARKQRPLKARNRLLAAHHVEELALLDVARLRRIKRALTRALTEIHLRSTFRCAAWRKPYRADQLAA